MSQQGVRRTGGAIDPADLQKYQKEIEVLQTVTGWSSTDCFRALQNAGFNPDTVVQRFFDGIFTFAILQSSEKSF